MSSSVPAGWSRYYDVVARIPRGRVTTYGTIARLAGAPRTARHVGWALAALHGKKTHGIPWHRVLGSRGKGFAGVSLPDESGTLQRRKLVAEKIRFDPRGRVLLEEFGWTGP